MPRNDSWLVLPNHQGHEVNAEGQIRNIKSGNILKTSVNQSGVRYASIQNTTTRQYENKAVAKLVAEAFCPGQTRDANTVLHLDGDTENNRADNLMWTTRWHAMGYHDELNRYGIEREHKARVQLHESGRIFKNALDAAKQTGCLPSAIDYACRYNDRLAKDTHLNFMHRTYPGGHIFKYA